MDRPKDTARFRLRTLFIGIAVTSVVLTALVQSTEWWRMAISTSTLFALSCSVVFAVLFGRQTKAFWLGFGVIGWVFYAATHDNLTILTVHPNELIPLQAILGVEHFIPTKPNSGYFNFIARDLSALMMAAFGGYVSRWVYDRQARSPN